MANSQLASFCNFLTPPLTSDRFTGQWPLFSRHPPPATIPSGCYSFRPGWTLPICEPSSFAQPSLSGFFARLAWSAYQVGWFRRVEDPTPRAASQLGRRAGLFLTPNYQRSSALSRHTEFTTRLPETSERHRRPAGAIHILRPEKCASPQLANLHCVGGPLFPWRRNVGRCP